MSFTYFEGSISSARNALAIVFLVRIVVLELDHHYLVVLMQT